MIELSSVLWLAVMLSGLLGFLRGWREEIQVMVIPIAYIYLLIQFDLFVRAIGFLANISTNVWFILHVIGFLGTTWYFGYRGHRIVDPRYGRFNSSASWLGALFGALNGWLLMGTFWYLMDIHEYPLTPYITAPSITSPSADAVWALPPVLFTGGISAGNPDFLLVVVLIAILIRFRA
jgi:hypothetical protein